MERGQRVALLSDALGVKAKRVWLNTLETTMKLDSSVATDIVSFHASQIARSTPFIGKSVIFYKSRALAFIKGKETTQ